MPRNAGVSVENNFTKGLITEVTGMNSPENSVSESLNIIYDRRGRASKRKGMTYELNYRFLDLPTKTGKAKSEFIWETAQTGSFVLAQYGARIYFFSNSTGNALSQSGKSFVVNLETYRADGIPASRVAEEVASYSSGKDYLFIAHPLCDPIYVKYDGTSDKISIFKITIKVRDFEGVDDKLAQGIRPTSLSNLHMYNLMNQGWYAEDFVWGNGGAYPANVLAYSNSGSWPSNSDIPWLWRQFSTDTNREEFAGWYRTKVTIGNSMAPRGHYILDAFNMKRSGLKGDGRDAYTTSGVPSTTSGQSRPSCIAFFMGRIFYSGVDAEGYRSSIYFSQVIERDEQIGYCHQSNDPTSEHAFDLLANDGGVIKILDIGKIVDIRTFGSTLFVFAENGVWSVSGTQTSPFSATDYSVSKVSSFGALSRLSIAELGETPIWWNNEGIYMLGKDKTGFESSVTNISESTIQTFYDKIPVESRRYAKGIFNDQTNLVYWLYSSKVISDPYDYDSILVLDVQSQAFYPLKLGVMNHRITGALAVRGIERDETREGIYTTLGEEVLNNSGELLQVVTDVRVRSSEKDFKFLTQRRDNNNMTFSSMVSETYADFSSFSAENYEDYFITGYRIRGELLKTFQTNYLVIMTENSDPQGVCYVQGIWDYSTSNVTGRFTNPQLAHGNDPATRYQRRKLRIRGSGYSLQFKFYGSQGKPFTIIGWSGFETANTTP